MNQNINLEKEVKAIKSFSDFNIELTSTALTGDKIDMSDLLNREIIITAYSIDQSKFPEKGNGKRLTLQFNIDERQRVVFTGSIQLQDLIQKVDPDNYPFSTTIIKQNKGYKFT